MAPGLCLGALTWENQKVELTAQVEDIQAIGVFRFKNSGGEVVTITSVKPSCGCTTAELAKAQYAPGETGEIKAVFKFNGGVGPQEKTILVTTSDAPASPTLLTLRVTIPDLFTYSTRLLLWKVGTEPVDQSLTLTCLRKIKSLEVEPQATAAVVCRVETTEPGVKYVLTIRPKSTAQISNSAVPLVVKFADDTTQAQIVYVLIR